MEDMRGRFELRRRTGQHIVVDDEVVSFREVRNLLLTRPVTVSRSEIESAKPIGPGVRIRTAERSYDIIVGLRPSKVATARRDLMSALGWRSGQAPAEPPETVSGERQRESEEQPGLG